MSARTDLPDERIIIADDHPMFRDALARNLRIAYPDAEVEEAGDLPAAIACAREGPQPVLFVLDLLFPGMDGPSSVSALRTEFTAASIVIVTMLEDPLVAQQILDAGADGYLGKGLTSNALLDGINAVRSGEYVINLAAPGQSPAIVKPVLTPRQHDILLSLGQNKPNKVIARDLGLSHFTVRNHITILMRSLKVQHRSQLSQRARALGLMTRSNAES